MNEGLKMREILFRGKSVANGSWVYGSLVEAEDNYEDYDGALIISKEAFHMDLQIAGRYKSKVAIETVGQYTGLNDSEGNKIFEGDIVSSHPASGEDVAVVVSWDREHNLNVAYDTDLYFLTRADEWRPSDHEVFSLYDALDEMTMGFLVTGNIHDNPELLEVVG